jgi:hypothetical protein
VRCARAVLPFRLSPSLPLPRVIDADDVTTSVFAGRDGDTRAMSQPRYKQRGREREAGERYKKLLLLFRSFLLLLLLLLLLLRGISTMMKTQNEIYRDYK